MRIKDISYAEMEHIIDEYVHNGIYRAVAKRKLHNWEIPFEELADEYKLSVTTVKNIVKEVSETICLHIKGSL